MLRIEKSIEIGVLDEKVWEMLAFDRFLEWSEGFKREWELKSVEYTSEVHTPKDKYRVGASAHGIPKKDGEIVFEVTESLENERLTYRSQFGEVHALVRYVLEPIEKGTKLTVVANYEIPYGILSRILEPLLFRRELEKMYERDLKNLKSILEK